MGQDYKAATREINTTTKLKISLASGGGWAAHIYPKFASKCGQSSLLETIGNHRH